MRRNVSAGIHMPAKGTQFADAPGAHEGDDHEGGVGPPEPFVIECEGVEYTVTSANGN